MANNTEELNDYIIYYNDSGEDYGASTELRAKSVEDARLEFEDDFGTDVIINDIEEG